jgi:hypothetical protein
MYKFIINTKSAFLIALRKDRSIGFCGYLKKALTRDHLPRLQKAELLAEGTPSLSSPGPFSLFHLSYSVCGLELLNKDQLLTGLITLLEL